MKIAFIINSLKSRNGASVFLQNLAVEYQKKYPLDEIVVISLFDNIDISIRRHLQLNKVNIKVCHKQRRKPFSGVKEFKKILNSFSPDIINTHLSILPTYFLSFGFKKKQWKIVKTFHSIPGKDLNKFSLRIERAYSKRNLISFIGISNSISEISKKIYPRNITKTIFNGIPIKKNEHNREKIYDYVIVASLEPVKNHMFLFELFNENKEYFFDKKLAVVGDGSLADEYKNYCCQNNLQNVVFLGNCDNVYGKLIESKIFLLVSTREGNPISLLEAINAGLPVLAPKTGGIPDIIVNEKIGYIFNVNDKEDFLQKIKLLDKDHFSFFDYNTEYSKTFSISKTAEEYRKFFLSLI